MSVKVNSEITVKISDQEIKMTGIEARILIKELEKVLGTESKNTVYRDIIYRDPYLSIPIVTCGTGSGQKPNIPEVYSVSADCKIGNGTEEERGVQLGMYEGEELTIESPKN